MLDTRQTEASKSFGRRVKKVAKIFLFELNFSLLHGTLEWMYEWGNRDGTYSLVFYFSLYPQNNKKNPWNQESYVLKPDFAALFMVVLYL